MTAAAPQEINRDRPKVGRPGQFLSIEGAAGIYEPALSSHQPPR